MAGESAQEVARRGREKGHAVQEALTQLPPEWIVLHDLTLPDRPRASIEHLVIGPGGVFVIHAKNWSGKVAITDGVLRQNGRSRVAAVEGVRSAAAAVAALVPSLSPEAFVPVLCFVGDTGIHANLGGVLTCRADSLITMLLTRPAVLSAERIEFLQFELDMSARDAAEDAAASVEVPAAPPAQTPAASPLPEATPGRHRRAVRTRMMPRVFHRAVRHRDLPPR